VNQKKKPRPCAGKGIGSFNLFWGRDWGSFPLDRPWGTSRGKSACARARLNALVFVVFYKEQAKQQLFFAVFIDIRSAMYLLAHQF